MKRSKKFMALLLALVLVFSLAACGSQGGETPTGGGTDTPSGGGDTPATATKTEFVYALGGSPNYLDPAIASDSIGSYVLNQIYLPLFILGDGGAVLNAACKDYTVDEDGLVYTFTLNDTYWSDGQKVTAEDFVYGVKHALAFGSVDAQYLTFVTDFVAGSPELDGAKIADMDGLGVVALDDSTLQITLYQPCEYFLSLLCSGVYFPLRSDVAPEGDYTWADDPNAPTNGYFHPTSIDRADRVVMDRNTYNESDKVSLERLTARVMEDMDAEIMAFRTGEIDYATSVEAPVAVSMFGGTDSLDIYDSTINYYVQFNSVMAPNPVLADVNVRRAFMLAINREELVEALDAGDAYYPLYGFVPNGLSSPTEGDFRDAGGDYCGYDPDAAKELLKDYPDGVTIEYYYNQNNMHDTVASVMKRQLAEVGITLDLKTADVRVFFDDRDTQGNYEAARGAMSADYMDSMTYLAMGLSTWQAGYTWGDATYDQMIAEANTFTGQERLTKLHEAEKYLVETQGYVCPLFGYKTVCLKNPNSTGYINNPQGNSFFYFVSFNG
ncbi:MAG: peptide ABC transporter substrate-binding protein [Oscillospiraceae bacterium]|nr:peptide ABC transporter substrate-binding protein [Oscillospiraceae bacterium]